MQGLVAMRAAAPLVRAGMMLAANGVELTLPRRPDGIASGDVCALSGLRPTEACPHRKRELFPVGRAPQTPCDWHVSRREIVYPDMAKNWARHKSAPRFVSNIVY
jgi:penicillin-binding protein 1C